jgi:methyl-galactoside transport system permease protein
MAGANQPVVNESKPSGGGAGPAGQRSALGSARRVVKFLSDNAIYSALVVLVLVIAVKDPTILSITCLRDILVQSSTKVIVAMGAFFAIVIAGADLSAGRQVGLAAVLSASMLQMPNYPRLFFPSLATHHMWLFLPIALAILACTLCGVLNGFFVAFFGVAPFIATLGTMVTVWGVNSIYFNSAPNNSQPIGGLRSDFTDIGGGAIGTGPYSIPYIVLIAVAVAVFMWVLLNKTPFGKNVYAMGGNVSAAQVSGVNVRKTTVVMFAIASTLYGLAGVLEASRTGGANNRYGESYELDAIAACVVGGVSVAGGLGTVSGILAGVLIFGVINYGLTYISIDPYWQLIIKGAIIVSAVAFDVRKYVKKK